MCKARRIIVYFLSFSLILATSATIPNLVSAQEVVSLDPVTFSGQRLPDTALAELRGMAGFTLYQYNYSTGANNTQLNNTNGIVWNNPPNTGLQTTTLNANTTQALQNLISLFKNLK